MIIMNSVKMAYQSVLMITILVTVFHIYQCLEEGPNVCSKQETYLLLKTVSYNKPRQIRYYTWCMAVPPRCSKIRIGYTIEYKTEEKLMTRIINECCKGFVFSPDANQCVPYCSECIHGICESPEQCSCKPGFAGLACNISDCSECVHGVCVAFEQCKCQDGFVGPACNISACSECENGICVGLEQCECKPGYVGAACNFSCPFDIYREQCERNYNCEKNHTCDTVNGDYQCTSDKEAGYIISNTSKEALSYLPEDIVLSKTSEVVVLDFFKDKDYEAVYEMLKDAVEEGQTLPEDTMDSDHFKKYYLSSDAFVIRSARGGRVMGSFYIKPNFPGRSSHICNGAFLVHAYQKRKGIKEIIITKYLQIAKDLGYVGSFFNLVYASNNKSLELYKKLGFQEIGVIPKAGKLESLGYVDAFQFYYDLTTL